ncbi:hypothetical protein DL96DRAFT_1822610 [Flagelloscypha sp. PMI_526]|nr:hypothetical protein DL96DRAFT_1822610 [Flagelloscypha sp. PMI_526]
MNSLGANVFALTESTSELTLSYSGESQPPGYTQLPQNTEIQPGKYVFRDVPTSMANGTTTVIVSKDGSAPPIYTIVTNKIPMVSAHFVVIRKGPPEIEGKLLGTFEIHGKDIIFADSKPQMLSRVFTYVKGSSSIPRSLYATLGKPHRWACDLTDMKRVDERRLLCHPGPKNPVPPKYWARFTFADPVRAMWKPDKYVAEQEVEIFSDGVSFMDDCVVSLVVMLLTMEDVVEKLLVLV